MALVAALPREWRRGRRASVGTRLDPDRYCKVAILAPLDAVAPALNLYFSSDLPAALLIKSAILTGSASIATWLVDTVIVVAFILFASIASS